MNNNVRNIIREVILYIFVGIVFLGYAYLIINQSVILMYIFIALGLISLSFIFLRKNERHNLRGRNLAARFSKKRMNIILIIIYIASMITGILTNERDIFSDTKSTVIFIIFSVVFVSIVLLITNFIFTKKTVFNDNKNTDEYITVLLITLFFGYLAVLNVDLIPTWIFILAYSVLLVNTITFTIEIITSVIQLNIDEITIGKALRNVGILFLVFILLIYIQNLSVYRFSGEIFNGSGFSLNPYFDLFYYSVVNITSVGFGDITPVGYFGKTTAIFSSICGYAIIFSILGMMLNKFSDKHVGKKSK